MRVTEQVHAAESEVSDNAIEEAAKELERIYEAFIGNAAQAARAVVMLTLQKNINGLRSAADRRLLGDR